jgi:hypothetical protein
MSRKTTFVPWDLEMLLDTELEREEKDVPLALQARQYNQMGIIVTSSRLCDDGTLVTATRWCQGLTPYDDGYVLRQYEGAAICSNYLQYHNWIN